MGLHEPQASEGDAELPGLCAELAECDRGVKSGGELCRVAARLSAPHSWDNYRGVNQGCRLQEPQASEGDAELPGLCAELAECDRGVEGAAELAECDRGVESGGEWCRVAAGLSARGVRGVAAGLSDTHREVNHSNQECRLEETFRS